MVDSLPNQHLSSQVPCHQALEGSLAKCTLTLPMMTVTRTLPLSYHINDQSFPFFVKEVKLKCHCLDILGSIHFISVVSLGSICNKYYLMVK